MPKPLEGIRVLEWAIRINGPGAGYMLGDLGAEVIKIERPGVGDDYRSLIKIYGQINTLPGNRTISFDALNRGKKSIALDLKKEKGKQVLYRLVEKSDVFFTNFHKNVQARVGADYQTLSKYNPKLIYAYNAGYGSRGPESNNRCFDVLVQARTGSMFAVGDKDNPEPFRMNGAQLDQAGATMLAHGIVTALLVRERWGIGQEIEVSLLNSAIHLQQLMVNSTLWTGHPWPRFSRKDIDNPLANLYECADGKWLVVAEDNSDRWWPMICQVLSKPELVEDSRFSTMEGRMKNNVELVSVLDKVFATRSREEWLRRFAESRFACAPVNTMDALATDRQVIENEYIVEIDHPTMGKVMTVGVPIEFSQTPAKVGCPAPELGQHTEEVLLEVGGYSWGEITQLKEEAVI